MATKTNADIFKAITDMTKELGGVKSELTDVKEQVQYTNGQVRALNTWKAESEAIERYKKDNPTPTVQVNNRFQWDWKAVLAIILTLATIAAGLNGVGAIR